MFGVNGVKKDLKRLENRIFKNKDEKQESYFDIVFNLFSVRRKPLEERIEELEKKVSLIENYLKVEDVQIKKRHIIRQAKNKPLPCRPIG